VSAEPPDGTSQVVQSVDRAAAAMEILAREGWVGVTQLAGELDIHKSTVSRLLSTLERRGLVEQHDQTGKYRLGFAVVRLASAVRASLDLARAARPVLDQLSRETQETVNLAVLEDREVVNIDHVHRSENRISVDWLGSHTALHCTSSGKVFLAVADPRRLADLLDSEPLERFTPHTLTEPAAIRREIERTRARGFASTVEEFEEGLNSVAAAIRDASGDVVASVSVSGPSYRLTADRLDDVGRLVVAAADDISHRLGFLGEPRFRAATS
jgi:DNA-binding IclR family transcriptional regulator